MKQTIQPQTYPKFLFLVEEGDGTRQWYNIDPLKAGNNESAKVDPGALLVDMLGHCTKANPIVVQIGGQILERSFAFDASIPTQMRKGGLMAHIRDYEGHYIEILPIKSNDPDYPFNAAVLDEAGEPLEFRKYSLRGVCSDGNADHSLIVFHGLLKVESDKDLEAMAESRQEAEPKKPRRRARKNAPEAAAEKEDPANVGETTIFTDFENM